MVTVTEKILVPTLRFSDFKEPWEAQKVSQLTSRLVDPVAVEPVEEYREIGIRSHGKGLFHKQKIAGSLLGNKRVFWVKPNCFIVNIVFAWEQAIAKTTEAELEFIASHRFPMYEPLISKANVDFLVYFFQRKKGKNILELASPGGAGRNKTLGQKEFEKTKLIVPKVVEQQKIAQFLASVDTKIQQLKRKHALIQQYKKGVMQQLFNQQVRFKADDGRAYPDWKKEPIGKYLEEFKERVSANTDIPVLTSSRTGLYLQKDYYANRELNNDGEYGVLPKGYFTYRHMSDDLTFKFNLNTQYERGAISKEYPVFRTVGMDSYFLMLQLNEGDEFRKFAVMQKQGGTRTRLYFRSLKELKLFMPHLEEQKKIANFIESIDQKNQQLKIQITQAETFKKGLLQQMFV